MGKFWRSLHPGPLRSNGFENEAGLERENIDTMFSETSLKPWKPRGPKFKAWHPSRGVLNPDLHESQPPYTPLHPILNPPVTYQQCDCNPITIVSKFFRQNTRASTNPVSSREKLLMTSYSSTVVRTVSHRPAQSLHAVSPTSEYLTQSTGSTATTSRSKDPQILLLQRWQRMTSELAARRLSRKSVVTLNRVLDEAKNSLAWDEPQASRSISQCRVGLGIGDDVSAQKINIGQAMTPPDSTILNAPEALESDRKEIRAIQRAEPVLERIEYLVAELRKRHEDFRVCYDAPNVTLSILTIPL